MSFPIVGARFRPPAQAIIQSLGVGSPLWLRPEPDNQFDSNAIAVWFKTSDLSPGSLEELGNNLPGYGMDLEEVRAEPEWQLGYLPARIAKGLNLTEEVRGQLTFDAKGGPGVEVEEEIPARAEEPGFPMSGGDVG
jgi:hypothetical protein